MSFDVGLHPRAVAAGDLDGDQDIDLAVANGGSDNVSILRNEGNGVFEHIGLLHGVGDAPGAVALVDADGDGDLDLTVGSSEPADGRLSLLLNHGDGSFAAPWGHAIEESPQSAALGDLDGDGDLDVVVPYLGSGGSITILLNAVDGTFAEAEWPVGAGPVRTVLDDMDGDGDLDVVVLAFDEIRLMLNSGSGTRFAISTVVVPSMNGRGVVADLGGDELGDVAVVVADEVVVVLNDEGTLAEHASVAPSIPPGDIVAGDFDGDGDADLVVGEFAGSRLATLLNAGDGSFVESDVVETGLTGFMRPGVADLDGDGDLDLARPLFALDAVAILMNDGAGSFGEVVTYPAGDGPEDVAIGDLDGDLDADLVIEAGLARRISVLLNEGDGRFAAPVLYRGAEGTLALGDMDGDDGLDVVAASSAGHMTVLLNTGDGTLHDVTLDTGGNLAADVAVGGLDGDGDADLVVGNAGAISVLRNVDGLFGAPTSSPLLGVPSAVDLADIDGDGDLDVVVSQEEADSITVKRNLGNGTLVEGGSYYAFNVTAFGLGDFDGDGRVDVAHRAGGELGLLLNEFDGFPCPADTNKDDQVDVDDLINVLLDWGCVSPPAFCLGGVTGNGVVDVDDLVAVILAWGPCSG